MPGNRESRRGFTMIEFIMVVAISGILIVGLGAVIDVPMEMVEEDLNGDASLSAADLAMATLDSDLRFAVDVSCPDPQTLVIDYADGTSVNYSWSNVDGDPLKRTDSGGTARLLRRVKLLDFELGMTEMRVRKDLDGTLAVQDKTAAEFDRYTLNPGYVRDTDPNPDGLTQVTVRLRTMKMDLNWRAGIFFKAVGLSADDASAVSLRVKMERTGPSDCVANVYLADEATQVPDFGKRFATGRLRNSEIPVNMSEVTMILTPELKMRNGDCYLVSIGSDINARCADIRYRELSRSGSGAPATTGFFYSMNNGFDWYPMGYPRYDYQIPFTFTAQEAEVDQGSADPYVVVQVPTSVELRMELQRKERVRVLKSSFPIPNKLAEVNR